MSAPTELIDVDAYLGPHPRLELGAGDPDQLLGSMRRTGIGTALVTHHRAVWYDAGEGNALASAACAAHPNLLACWVLLPDACGELPEPTGYVAAAREVGVVAFRASPTENGYDLCAPECAAILEALAAAGLPLLVDADQLGWAEIDRLARANPQLTITVCRVGYRTLRVVVGVLERRANVVLDLANLSAHGGIAWLCARLGSTRLLFGTASPVRDPAEAVTNLLWSELSDDDVHNIASANARRLFAIPEPNDA